MGSLIESRYYSIDMLYFPGTSWFIVTNETEQVDFIVVRPFHMVMCIR